MWLHNIQDVRFDRPGSIELDASVCLGKTFWKVKWSHLRGRKKAGTDREGREINHTFGLFFWWKLSGKGPGGDIPPADTHSSKALFESSYMCHVVSQSSPLLFTSITLSSPFRKLTMSGNLTHFQHIIITDGQRWRSRGGKGAVAPPQTES